MSRPLFPVFETINGETRMLEHDALKQTDAEIAAGVTPVNYAYLPGDSRRFGCSPSASAAVNAVAIQNTIDSNEPECVLPAGTIDYDTTLVIDRAIIFRGAGSCEGAGNATGNPGAATTKLNFTGTASTNGIVLVGSGTEGKENIHLRDFSLFGTSSAGDGILLGITTATLVTKCSLRNVHVKGFTNPDKKGIRFCRVLETLLENVYTQGNYDGMGNVSGDISTTIRMVNSHSRTNVRNGLRITGSFSGCSPSGLITEGNGEAGLYLSNAQCIGTDFHSFYSEADNQTGGTAPVVITGGSTLINFFGGYIAGAVSGRSIDIDSANQIVFYETQLTTYAAGFMRVTSSSTDINFHTSASGIAPNAITGNNFGACRVHSGSTPGQYRIKGIANAGTQSLPYTAGILLITDLTNKKSAMFSLNGSLNTTTEWLDPATAFSAASGTASMINIAYSSGYFVQNNSGGTIDLLITALNTDFLQ